MKRYWTSFGILTAVILVGISPVLAHEECDEEDRPKVVNAAGVESEGRNPSQDQALQLNSFNTSRGEYR